MDRLSFFFFFKGNYKLGKNCEHGFILSVAGKNYIPIYSYKSIANNDLFKFR